MTCGRQGRRGGEGSRDVDFVYKCREEKPFAPLSCNETFRATEDVVNSSELQGGFLQRHLIGSDNSFKPAPAGKTLP